MIFIQVVLISKFFIDWFRVCIARWLLYCMFEMHLWTVCRVHTLHHARVNLTFQSGCSWTCTFFIIIVQEEIEELFMWNIFSVIVCQLNSIMIKFGVSSSRYCSDVEVIMLAVWPACSFLYTQSLVKLNSCV